MATEIPTEFYVAWLDRSFPIHWNYHAWLMFLAAFVLVVVLEGRGHRHDTYEAVFGSDPELPGNAKRRPR